MKRAFGVFFISSLFVLCLFWLFRDATSPLCSDCFRPHGFPFHYYHDGGFAGGQGWFWPNVWNECIAMLSVSGNITWLWTALDKRRRRK
jgi:hypothetical protein